MGTVFRAASTAASHVVAAMSVSNRFSTVFIFSVIFLSFAGSVSFPDIISEISFSDKPVLFFTLSIACSAASALFSEIPAARCNPNEERPPAASGIRDAPPDIAVAATPPARPAIMAGICFIYELEEPPMIPGILNK